MKLTILLGWAVTDASGNPKGAAKVISGPPEDESAARAQGAMFHDAKQNHKFPKGIRHMAFANVEVLESAAFINEDLAEQIAGRQQVQFEQVEAALKKAEAKKAQQTAVADASARVSKAAVALNTASASLQTSKNRLLDAESNFKATRTDSHKAEIETYKTRVTEATKSEASAREELNAAKSAKADLLAGKTTTQPPIPGT